MVDFNKASLAGRIVTDVIGKLRSNKCYDQVFDVSEDLGEFDELLRELKAVVYKHLTKGDKE